MNRSVLDFLMPQWNGAVDGGLQVVVALLLLALVIGLPLLLARSARPAQWEARLGALTGERHTLPAPTTPEELSQAVATAPERWAQVAPGMVLMLGLLGSFIGLGLALGETAAVLGPQQAPGALAAVIDALGAKFRMATWGILAYLILKICITFSAREQARLAWSVSTLRRLDTEQAHARAQLEAQDRQRLIDAITHSGNALLAAQQAEAQRAHLRHAELMDTLQRQTARSS